MFVTKEKAKKIWLKSDAAGREAIEKLLPGENFSYSGKFKDGDIVTVQYVVTNVDSQRNGTVYLLTPNNDGIDVDEFYAEEHILTLSKNQ